jgi:hypothetical protein
MPRIDQRRATEPPGPPPPIVDPADTSACLKFLFADYLARRMVRGKAAGVTDAREYTGDCDLDSHRAVTELLKAMLRYADRPIEQKQPV